MSRHLLSEGESSCAELSSGDEAPEELLNEAGEPQLVEKTETYAGWFSAKAARRLARFEAARDRLPGGGGARPLPAKKLKALLRKGVPPQHRAEAWWAVLGCEERKSSAERAFSSLATGEGICSVAAEQIERDLERTFPAATRFQENRGRAELRRVLQAFACFLPKVQYCQGLNYIAAVLLSVFSEAERAFWALVCAVERIGVEDYYSEGMRLLRADMKVLGTVVRRHRPKVAAKLDEFGVDVTLLCSEWFITWFSKSLPTRTVLRVWDTLFLEGFKILFRISLGIFSRLEEQVLQCKSFESLLEQAPRWAQGLVEHNELLKASFTGLRTLKRRNLLPAREEALRQVDSEDEARRQRRGKSPVRSANTASPVAADSTGSPVASSAPTTERPASSAPTAAAAAAGGVGEEAALASADAEPAVIAASAEPVATTPTEPEATTAPAEPEATTQMEPEATSSAVAPQPTTKERAEQALRDAGLQIKPLMKAARDPDAEAMSVARRMSAGARWRSAMAAAARPEKANPAPVPSGGWAAAAKRDPNPLRTPASGVPAAAVGTPQQLMQRLLQQKHLAASTVKQQEEQPSKEEQEQQEQQEQQETQEQPRQPEHHEQQPATTSPARSPQNKPTPSSRGPSPSPHARSAPAAFYIKKGALAEDGASPDGDHALPSRTQPITGRWRALGLRGSCISPHAIGSLLGKQADGADRGVPDFGTTCIGAA